MFDTSLTGSAAPLDDLAAAGLVRTATRSVGLSKFIAGEENRLAYSVVAKLLDEAENRAFPPPRNSLKTCKMRSAAAATSAVVVKAPTLNRSELSNCSAGRPIARSVDEVSLEPDAQAEPVEQATPA